MSVAPIFLCAILLSVAGVAEDQPYCAVRYRRLCQDKGLHVGCQFPEPGPGPSCQNYSPIKFQDNLRHFITHYINRRRQRIAAGTERVRGGQYLPKPEVMMMVEWDRELAVLAQRLADQCTFTHDECRATVRFPYAGQTVGEVRWRRSSASDELTAQRAIRRVFDAWWGERRRVQPHQLIAPFRLTAKGAVWGHFSQLAVWTLRAVGCGAVRHGLNYPRLLLVCDFSHTNMLGQRTISPGTLTRCPIHTARRPRSSYPLLCAAVRYPARTEHYQYESETEDDTDEESDENIPTIATPQSWNKTLTNTHMWKVTTRGRGEVKSRDGNTEYKFQVIPRRKSKGAFQDKLDRELEVKKKGKSKNHLQNSYDEELTWQSSKEEFPSSLQTKSKRTSTTFDESDLETKSWRARGPSEQTYVARHKWHHSRDRPSRPGASALINIPVHMHTRRHPVVSLMLDKEDIEQLFRDTGFNPSWMKQRPIP